MNPVFIAEITARAFIIADSNKRRTLSRSDISKALSKSDQFDFLIDIVPREEPLGASSSVAVIGSATKGKKKLEQVCLH
jgi:nuclear transcription factor Y, gamma